MKNLHRLRNEDSSVGVAQSHGPSLIHSSRCAANSVNSNAPLDSVRDIFPLPLFDKPAAVGKGGSRRARKCERNAIIRECNSTLEALNWMSGCHHLRCGARTASQKTMVARVWDLHASKVPPPMLWQGRQL